MSILIDTYLEKEGRMRNRIETALHQALAKATSSCPPRLAAAMEHAVFPGGHRLRPRLCLTVARACGDGEPVAADAAAAAIEFIHCASLVHDDLPCFDDADLRRGRSTVHKVHGEPIAVLAGDTLIILAFETIVRGAALHPERAVGLVRLIGQAAGAPYGICAGQAWESETIIPITDYHRAKTSSLFAAATASGALAAGHEPESWRCLGERIGSAYQVADDIRDAVSSVEESGKPVGQDAAHSRPNAVQEFGLHGALGWLDQLIEEAVESLPACPGQGLLKGAIRAEAAHFLPEDIAIRAA
jgi:geranylgeranyl diphosphate synthase, type II